MHHWVQVLHMTQACMLIALEEEAALEVHPEMVEVLQAMPELRSVRVCVRVLCVCCVCVCEYVCMYVCMCVCVCVCVCV